MFRIPLCNTYIVVMCDHVTWSVFRRTFVTVFYERFRKVAHSVIPQCNTVVHAMECNRSMRLRKVCAQCNTVVHVKRSVCDCGHAFASKKGKQCIAVGKPENAMKRRKALLSEEGLLVGKEGDKVRKTSKRASETREQTLHR